MNRLGLEPDDLDEFAGLVHDNTEHLVVVGVSTHYAGAESVSNDLRIQRQIETYERGRRQLADRGIVPQYHHTACSAAALVYPETIMDMVRIGIAQYGYWPSREVQVQIALEDRAKGRQRLHDPLKRVITWKSRVMATKEVAAGEFIGYGTAYLANAPRKIAVVPVGYAEGFTRRLSNMGRVLIRGRRFAVIGVVNMNMMTIDVTDSPDIEAGDEVVLIGAQKKHTITVASFSEMSQFLNYEMLVRLSREIPKFVVPSSGR
jgi:alanine racemase